MRMSETLLNNYITLQREEKTVKAKMADIKQHILGHITIGEERAYGARLVKLLSVDTESLDTDKVKELLAALEQEGRIPNTAEYVRTKYSTRLTVK